MWDTVNSQHSYLPRELPCALCGHAKHTYLPCSDECECDPDIEPPALAS